LRPAFLAVPLLILASLGLVAGCSSDDTGRNQPLQGTALGIDPEAIDKAISPGDDFYLYANGSWQESTAIPPSQTSVGAWLTAYDNTQSRLSTLIEDIAGQPQEDGSNSALIAEYYQTFMNTAAIDKAGFAPVRGDLDRFAAIGNVTDLSRVLGEQLEADVDAFNNTNFETENLFGVFVTKSLKSDVVVPYLMQGGLGLPGRDDYLATDQKAAGNRAAYRDYIARILQYAGYRDADRRAKAVLELETKIALAHMTANESYEMANRTQEWALADFDAKAPGMDWPAFFAAAGLEKAPMVEAYHDRSIPKLSALVKSEPLDVWKDWLAFHQINAHVAVMPGVVRQAHFQFFGRRLDGKKEMRLRSEDAVAETGRLLGDALGRLYAEEYLPDEERRDVEIMVDRVQQAFADRIENNTWMNAKTKEEALSKVREIRVGIGLPKNAVNYRALSLKGKSAYAMTVAAERFETRRQIAKIGKPIDRDEWWINPHIVNALNLPVQNAINFPAALLQKPFYDPEADAAFNYGALGSVIGHEIVHSFDSEGADFDASGVMRNWWTNEDRAEFRRRSAALVKQFAAYTPLPGLHIDGERTLAENIADLVGMAAAYDAYHASLDGKEPPVIEGFTGDQRFFIAYAQSNASKRRPASLRNALLYDGHSPDHYRTLTVRNFDAWYRAFNVEKGEALYLEPADRVSIF